MIDFSSLIKAAMAYVDTLGWPLFPCYGITPEGSCDCGDSNCRSPGKHPRTKRGHREATSNVATIREWWSQWPNANIGIATGTASGIDVLDVDPRHGGDDSLANLVKEYGELPETAEQITGSGGRHVFFKHDDAVRNHAGILAGLDIRGEGGYVVVPPSRHINGSAYEWELSREPDRGPLAPWPAWLLKLVTRVGAEPATAVEGPISDGIRNATLTSLAGTMRRRGMSEEAIVAALLAENRRCAPPLKELEVRGIASGIMRYEPGEAPVMELIISSGGATTPPETLLPATDMGNAGRLIHYHGKNLRFCGKLGGWFVFDGRRWVRDEAQSIMEKAKDAVVRIADEVQSIDDDRKKHYIKHALRSQGHSALRAMIALGESDPKVCVPPGVFDQHHRLFNVANGTLNLHTGHLGPHEHEHMLTQISDVEYDASASCPRWDEFLLEVMSQKQDLVEFLQRMVGYSLTGSTDEDAFFILYGSGRNGKSTFLETVKTMMGDYGMTAEATTFMEKRNDAIPNDLAALRGARLVLASETGPRRSLNEPLIKRVTGGDDIAVRFLNREFFTYTPRFKIIVATNDRPRVHGSDAGLWRRIRMIPFREDFGEREDKELSRKLQEELPGILNWAVAGCKAWLEDGLGTTDDVEAATQAYRDEMDVLGDFLDECCIVALGEQVKKRDLYQGYVSWADQAKERPMAMITFGKILVHRADSVEECRTGGGTRCWRGISLRASTATAGVGDTGEGVVEF